jgi:hypothetical protein
VCFYDLYIYFGGWICVGGERVCQVMCVEFTINWNILGGK